MAKVARKERQLLPHVIALSDPSLQAMHSEGVSDYLVLEIHTYTTLLTQNNEDVKVVQELLRHANSRITLDLYAQAGMAGKREAQRKVVEMVLSKGKAVA